MRFLEHENESIRSSTKAFLELVASVEKLTVYGAGSSSSYLAQGLLFRWGAIRQSHRLAAFSTFTSREQKALTRFESVLKTLPQSLPSSETATEEFLRTPPFERIPLAARQCLTVLTMPPAARFFQRVGEAFRRVHPVSTSRTAVFSPSMRQETALHSH